MGTASIQQFKLKKRQLENAQKNVLSYVNQAEMYLYAKNYQQYHRAVITRIFIQQQRQMHLLRILESFTQDNKQQDQVLQRQEQFLEEVSAAELQILDSLYEHLVVRPPQKYTNLCNTSPNQCMSVPCVAQPTSHNYNSILSTQSPVQIIDLSQNIQSLDDYQQCKTIGFNLIKSKKICFILFAGGKNIRYGLNHKKEKQFQSFPKLPSKLCLIEILFRRLEALGRLTDCEISLYIMISSHQKRQKYDKLNISQYTKLKIYYLEQFEYGCLDAKGGIVIDDNKSVFMHPNGTGDLWGFFQSKGGVRKQLLNYQYMICFGLSNIQEHCFDCYAIGKAKKDNFSWVTLSCESKPDSQNFPVIFLDEENKVNVKSPDQPYFPANSQHIFLNNTIVSCQFLKKIFNSQNPSLLQSFRVKKKITMNQYPLSNYDEILVFERQFSDIFKVRASNKRQGCVILVKKEDYFSPLIYPKHLKNAAQNLSQKYKRWIYLQFVGPQKIIEIDPFLSLEGENLQQCFFSKLQLQKLEFPIHLTKI